MRTLFGITLYACALLALPFSAPSNAQGMCTHLGESVECPGGVTPGSESLRFEGMFIIWADGSMTPTIECCSPFDPMIPEPPEPTPPEPTPPEPTPPEPTPPEPTPPEPTPPEPTPPEPTPPEPTPPEPTPPVKDDSIGLDENLELKGPTDMAGRTPEPSPLSPEKTSTAPNDEANLNSKTFTTLEEEVEKMLEAERASSAVPIDNSVSYCGPDVTDGFLEALELIAARIQALPDTNKGTLDGLAFMLANGQDMDYLPRLDFWQGNNPNCPNNRCASSDPCFTLFDTCVPRHVLSDTLYGFAVGMVGLHRQEAVAGGAYAEYNKRSGDGWLAAAKAALEDIGGPASDMKENPASVGAYYFGHSIAVAVESGKLGGEGNTPVSGMKPDDVKEEGDALSTFDRYIKPSMNQAYAWMKDCKTCPDTTPLYTYGWVQGIFAKRKDWSRMSWTIKGEDGEDMVQEVNDEFLFLDPFEDKPKEGPMTQTGANTFEVSVEDKLDLLEPVIKKHASYFRRWERYYNDNDIQFEFEDDQVADAP
ncbi:MAG: hypothetical protein NXI15_10740 [Gammaproteobacteria bacterium]|nr:hypothetical protein [Gammaproteobacteria bacterium]